MKYPIGATGFTQKSSKEFIHREVGLRKGGGEREKKSRERKYLKTAKSNALGLSIF